LIDGKNTIGKIVKENLYFLVNIYNGEYYENSKRKW
jgi:hypothetical protein